MIMKKICFYLSFLVLCISGCTKKNIVDSSTEKTSVTETRLTTGSLTGTVSPAGAITEINFVLTGTNSSYKCIPDLKTGVFDMKEMPEGNYAINFITDPHYNGIPLAYTTIIAGKNKDLGTFTTKETNFSLSYEINGNFEGSLYKAYYTGTNLSLGPLSVSTYPEDTRTKYYLSIRLEGISSPGTYICKGTSLKISYSGVRQGSGLRISYQSTEYAGGEGSVIITSIDPNTKTIKGSFSGKLTSVSGNAADTKMITNGIINATY